MALCCDIYHDLQYTWVERAELFSYIKLLNKQKTVSYP